MFRLAQPGFEVKVMEGGIMTEAATVGRAGPGGKRGKVQGWTFASRRRFREFLLSHVPQPGRQVYDVTLTIPGKNVSAEERAGIWSRWRMAVERAGLSCIWRLELQQRGQPHWHCIVGAPEVVHFVITESDLKGTPGLRGVFEIVNKPDNTGLCGRVPVAPELWMRWQWWRCIGAARARLKGAHRYSVHVGQDEGGLSARWFRYVADHASKSKQAQIAVGLGRHWGVIGRDYLTASRVLVERQLNDRQKAWLLRLLRRRNRRSIPAECVFGFRLGHAARRGTWGRAVWFGHELQDRRLVDAACEIGSSPPPTPALMPYCDLVKVRHGVTPVSVSETPPRRGCRGQRRLPLSVTPEPD